MSWSRGFRGTLPNPHQEQKITNFHRHLSTFMGVPPVDDYGASSADVIVQGIPFDITTGGRPGTRYGPQAIRLASSRCAPASS